MRVLAEQKLKLLSLIVFGGLVALLINAFSRIMSGSKLLVSILNPDPSVFPESMETSDLFLVWLVSNPAVSATLSLIGLLIYCIFLIRLLLNAWTLFRGFDARDVLTRPTVSLLRLIVINMLGMYFSTLLFFKTWNLYFVVFIAVVMILQGIIKRGFEEIQEEIDSVV